MRPKNWLGVLLVAVILTLFQSHSSIAQDVASGVPKEPHLSIPSSMPFYPAEGKRLGLTGRVGLEYSIDKKGYAQRITVVEPSNSLLDKHAAKMLSSGHFDIPTDWALTGGPERRYRIGFIFELSNKPSVPKFEDNRTTIAIKTTGLPGS